MITDLVSQGDRYAHIHPAFGEAFTFLNSSEPAELPIGAHDRATFTAVVIETTGKEFDGARLEYHERDIDIHMTLRGQDVIGWRPRALCRTPDGEFDAINDIGFVQDRPELWVPVQVGGFAVFFPDDGHAPLAGKGPLRKIVLKIVDARP
jgi:YhcH/YjgK/YiaL family protein